MALRRLRQEDQLKDSLDSQSYMVRLTSKIKTTKCLTVHLSEIENKQQSDCTSEWNRDLDICQNVQEQEEYGVEEEKNLVSLNKERNKDIETKSACQKQ